MKLDSVITCPNCGAMHKERMPQAECLYFYTCASCAAQLRPNTGDCCVFCSFGDVACPSMQAAESGSAE